MGRVFVSYSREDSETIDRLVKQLENAGHQVWLDRGDILTGDQWRARIVAAVDSSDVALIILSQNSVNSDNVRREVDLATEANIPILPVVIEPVEIPPALRYQLVGLQRLDISTEGIQPLLAALEANIARTAPYEGRPKRSWDNPQAESPTRASEPESRAERKRVDPRWLIGCGLILLCLCLLYVIVIVTVNQGCLLIPPLNDLLPDSIRC
jgi:hypothetical protein